MTTVIFILTVFAPSVVFYSKSRTPLTGCAATPIIPLPTPETKPSTPDAFSPSKNKLNTPKLGIV